MDTRSRGNRAERGAQFDRFVTREWAGLLAEVIVLLDDRDRAERLLRRVLEDARRSWEHDAAPGDPADRVRDAVVARLDPDDHTPSGTAPDRPVTLVALAALPAVQRRALVLHHVLGRSVEQVAADTGAAVATVRLRLAHGAWALACRHPDSVTVPRQGSVAVPFGPSPIEHWAAIELGSLRRQVALRPYTRAVAAPIHPPTATPASAGPAATGTRTAGPRRTMVRAAVGVLAAGTLAVIGAAYADVPLLPASATPAASVPASVVAP